MLFSKSYSYIVSSKSLKKISFLKSSSQLLFLIQYRLQRIKLAIYSN